MLVLSEDFKEKSLKKLEAASSGKFFSVNSAKLLPSFDRAAADGEAPDSGDDANGKDILQHKHRNRWRRHPHFPIWWHLVKELTLGKQLGEGAFCVVKEIAEIVLKRVEGKDPDDLASSIILPEPEQASPEDGAGETDEGDFPVNFFKSRSEVREYMSKNCMREDEVEGDNARYALKMLKPTNSQKQLEQGLIDISVEAKFLACLNHPNVIKMRGIAGVPLTANFGIVLDRLYKTLEDQMDEWTEEKKVATSSGLCGCLGGSLDPGEKSRLRFAAVTAAYDLSSAMRYLHSQK